MAVLRGKYMKVKIKDLEYVIVEEDDGDNVYGHSEKDIRLGLCDFLNQKIYLYKYMLRTRKRKILAHELTHAFIEAYGFYQDKYTEEQLCEFMAAYSKEINDICDRYFEEN